MLLMATGFHADVKQGFRRSKVKAIESLKEKVPTFRIVVKVIAFGPAKVVSDVKMLI